MDNFNRGQKLERSEKKPAWNQLASKGCASSVVPETSLKLLYVIKADKAE
jgi:hypothetical protein